MLLRSLNCLWHLKSMLSRVTKILVKGVGGVVAYKSSGRPAVYPTHQEILLDLVEDKA